MDRENRLLKALAVQRLGFLRPEDKQTLFAVLESGLEFRSLILGDIAALIGKPIAMRSFDACRVAGEAEEDLGFLERVGARFASSADSGYPAALREIPGAPFGLYLRGCALPSEHPCLSIVGTRYPTPEGICAAETAAAECADAGIGVVSGLARGLDSAAHRGALSRRGFTCAVLPCGIERVYPQSSSSLASSILENGGLLLSEYPPASEIYRSHFPERNRLISGLGRGVLVCEAPAGSGALITADFALEQGRDVFVSASRLGGPRSAGLDRLAEDGAKAVAGVSDILCDWGMEMPPAMAARAISMPDLGLAVGTASAASVPAALVSGASAVEAGFLAESLRAELFGQTGSRA